ncbi:hypothetical protein CK203_064210 [Vitis vinifera]|uniref:PGG domain-containing protein n=1 Tax=Vitis vinifera TaxID=29760 RepID=A0A438G6V3_VITVI|nr:hypothetical protein CK203_064210 [Vitis vinifera]
MQWFDERVLFKVVMENQWEEVVDIIKEHSPCASVRITTSKDTALHLAVSDGREEILEHLVQVLGDKAKDALKIKNDHGNTPLHLAAALGNKRMCQCITDVNKDLVGQRNDDGHTPLFLTALYGKVDAFTFFCQICLPKGIQEYYRGARGESILHTAINGEHFKLALLILNNYEELMFTKDEKRIDPSPSPGPRKSKENLPWSIFLMTVIAATFGALSEVQMMQAIYHFKAQEVNNPMLQTVRDSELKRRSCSHYKPDTLKCCGISLLLREFRNTFVQRHPLVISCEFVKGNPRLKITLNGQQSRNTESRRDRWFPPNYGTCCYFLNLIYSVLLVIFGWGKLVSNSRANGENAKNSGQRGDAETGLAGNARELPPGDDYRAGFKLMKLVRKLMPMIVLGYKDIQKIKHIKEKHVWSLQIVKKMLDTAGNSGDDAAGRFGKSNQETSDMDLIHEPSLEETKQSEMDRTETSILTAASNGIIEMVELILNRFPTAIYDKNSKKKNIVLLAAENRQPHLFDLLKQKKINQTLFHAVDSDGNSALHLAANYNQSLNPWTIPGTALQMQWEIKWVNLLFIMLVSPIVLRNTNEYVKSCVGPNSLMLYNNKGKTAMEIFTETHKQLIKEGGEWLLKTSDSCSVVAALIATVAFTASATVPGSTEKGKPVLENDLAFQVFSISSLVSLCFSVTALIMFLLILSSRYQVSEFKMGLPKKLLLGISSLLISIAAVLVSFCTGHFFILNDQLRSVAVPIYAVTCLPATIFALGQLPLYIDLICAIFTKVPVALYNGKFAGKKEKF